MYWIRYIGCVSARLASWKGRSETVTPKHGNLVQCRILQILLYQAGTEIRDNDTRPYLHVLNARYTRLKVQVVQQDSCVDLTLTEAGRTATRTRLPGRRSIVPRGAVPPMMLIGRSDARPGCPRTSILQLNPNSLWKTTSVKGLWHCLVISSGSRRLLNVG